MKTIWFKAKQYGWGWYPSTWQGWVVLGPYLLFMIWNATNISDPPSDNDLIPFLIKTGIATAVLLGICWWKGETPRWRWGEEE